MKLLFILLLFVFYHSCRSTPAPEPTSLTIVDEAPQSTCLILYNLKSQKFEVVSSIPNCHERYPAASTFKIPLAVMAFDTGVLKDKNTTIEWDKKKYPIEAWNKDHTAETWMQDSVVWYSQQLTPKIGGKKIEEYLKYFRYGNQDMSSGLKYAWLTPAPFIDQPMSNSLRISGVEQALFLKELWYRSLPRVSRKAQNKAISLLAVEKSPKGSVLRGKTGSGFIGEKHELRVGWFVGHLKSGRQEYIVVSNFVDKEQIPGEKTYGGRFAKERLLSYLAKNNLW